VNNGNNTDDVGLVSPKVGVDSPKGVRYYFHFRDTFSCLHATLTERIGLSRNVLVTTWKASSNS
jgi:hypothetical protein